ncbi:uncharacterized protein LOC131624540 [Vicia villosa]|uniref:uncharacterized protein LOC131624540 n=1 Tax=Vicia villosa TaxID=3911 RepID=UPI00273CACF5|nr:uncharacterized protein LOC131624540 [Vicia villosa]
MAVEGGSWWLESLLGWLESLLGWLENDEDEEEERMERTREMGEYKNLENEVCVVNAGETSRHILFECQFARNIWNWMVNMLQNIAPVNSMQDCMEILNLSWSPQAKTVVLSYVTSLFHQIWRARNLRRFEDTILHWKTRVLVILTNAKLVGNSTARNLNSSIVNFTLLKGFDITIHPRKPLRTLEILWTPPPMGWIKGNIDGIAQGSPSMAACGGIFRDGSACYITSSGAFIGTGNFVVAELMSAIIAIEKACELGWRKIWIEIDCSLVVKAFSNAHLVP